MRLNSVAIGVLLLVAGTQASALTLGRARGAAWIGQPLELMVPVTVDAGQNDGAVCAEADVFHGDSRIEAGRVQVSVEPTAQADVFNIRIASGTLIDEPVVTVYVRAGCSQKSSRRFVLLADFPSDAGGAPTRPATAAALVQPPLVTPIDSTTAKSGWAAANEAGNTTAQRTKPPAAEKPVREAPKPAPVAKSAPAPAPAPAPKPEKAEEKPAAKDTVKAAPTATAGAGKARLKLDPLENLTERIKSLESSTVAAPSEEAARDSQRMQQLQGDIKALLDQAAKNESNLMAMRERLEKAESERVPMFVVYVLMGLLGVCLAGLAYVWTRKSNRREWQNQSQYVPPLAPEAHTSPVTEQFEDDIPSQVAAERPAQVVAPAVAAKPIAPVASIAPVAAKPAPQLDPALDDVDVNLMDMDESSFSKLMGVEKPTKKKPVLSDEPQWPVAAVANYDFQSDEVIDIRQQATFFAKLGKIDESIEMLEAAIRNKPENSPFLYLDLLDIATTHSLKTDFRQFRDEFEERFNVRVPEFAMFKDKGRSVESYPDVQIKLGDVWETPAELATIESLILRNPQVEAGAGLDIAAFTELLELHAAARKRHSVRRAFAETKTATSDFINLKL